MTFGQTYYYTITNVDTNYQESNFSREIGVAIGHFGIFFGGRTDYNLGSRPTCVFCADLDGDRDMDLAVSVGDHVSILKNNGDGTFQTKVDYAAGSNPHSVFCADLDGDLDFDLAVANYNSNNVSILKNNGDGTFQTKVDYGEGSDSYPSSVFCADLDGDGDLDLAVALCHSVADSVSFLENNGDGKFQQGKASYSVGWSPLSVFCADLDGDGDLDLGVANVIEHSLSIFFNQSNTTYVEKDKGDRMVSSFALSQNYPNPFNSETVIEYTLPKQARVKIVIYNVLGQKVKTLLDQKEPLGYRRVIWDGKNENGETVSSGIYFYRIETEGFIQAKKMLLLK
ncbi:MAG: T9SS type A sorting domain-containing protein [candidate division Zixibacteria bacterium]|nr:T9SS type A sorting domain-containing protein [candidate division Zixibacteria bacterium]